MALQEEFILHGDVKPSNVFLVPAGDGLVAQLGDFGLARECPRKERFQSIHARWEAPFLCGFQGQGPQGVCNAIFTQAYKGPSDSWHQRFWPKRLERISPCMT